ncbi:MULTISPECIES: hypothetical protein [unclassified Streptomyces]|uniref:hypothetical protein n=1 Tax=unclassified Streptomyces TaxID=2593676 RepID=UPI002E2D77B3|nr:hypothetical protein [Streptomyces sp. NBC_00223]
MPRLARYSLIVCLLAVAAAVVSFVYGHWVGVVWLLLAGLTSNMWWYYSRKARLDAKSGSETAAAAGNGS